MKLSADEERVNQLSAKVRAGWLTESEAQELDSYLHIGMLLGVLHPKLDVVFSTDPAPT